MKIRNTKGFTLIELMIVVVIIGILAALAIPRFNQASARAKENTLLKQIYTLQQTYYANAGAYAATYAQLQTVGYEAPGALRNYTAPAAPSPFPLTMASCTGTGYNNRQITDQGVISNGAAC
jgi:prepilin-type N-terminal cleavage/methylation domain-containing protein